MYVFSSIRALPNVSDGTYYVYWEGNGDEDVRFRVHYSRENEGPWTLVNTYNAVFATISLDVLNLNFVDPIFFRVTAIRHPAATTLAVSDIVSDAYIPERTHYLRYKEIIRRSDLDIRRFVGARDAYLLRRKTYGTTAANVNPILNMPIGLEDADGKGQRFDGGYHTPILFKCGWIPGDDDSKMTVQEHGVSDTRFSSIKLLPTPIVRPYDIIVNQDTNDRYIVKAPVKHGTFRGLTITQVAAISFLPYTDKAYKFPVP